MNTLERIGRNAPDLQVRTPKIKWGQMQGQPSAYHKKTKSSTLATIIPQVNAELVR